MRDRGTHHHGPLAGVSAGAAAVLFATVVLLLAWHRVAAQVSTGITVLVYVAVTAVCALLLAVLVYAFLWLRHRVRHPETLAGRQAVRAEVVDDAAPQAVTAAQPAAIGPPRVYFTDAQFAEIMRQQVAVTQLPRDDQDQRPA